MLLLKLLLLLLLKRILSSLELPPSFLAACPSLVLSIYCGLKEEQETARSLRSLVTASLVNGNGRHVIHMRESGKI